MHRLTGTIFILLSLHFIAPAQDLSYLTLPPGFQVSLFAEKVENARQMAMGREGIIYVGSRKAGNVYAMVDSDLDFKADKVITIASGLKMPSGIAYRNGSLYVAEVHRVIRFDKIDDHLEDPPEPVVVNGTFPTDTHHGWKFIAFGPDGKLYVPVGAPCNVCDEENDIYASITRMNENGSGREVFAEGIRNTVGFDWHPVTKELWFTDNGRDMMGDNLPPDELNRAPNKGMHFGFPYCHAGFLPDPDFGKDKNCADYTAPAKQLGPHVAALGMKFYTGSMFPGSYKNKIFIAEHGSWNRSVPIGYRIMVVTLDNNEVTGYDVFMEGWLQKDGKVLGRPNAILQLPDGSLLVSDDYEGNIYRITYKN